MSVNQQQESLVIVGTFFSLAGIRCYTAYRLAHLPAIAQALTHYSNRLVPFVLIGLGCLILVKSYPLEYRVLTVLMLGLGSFCLLAFNRNQSLAATTESDKN